ncbi:MAG: asparagine synthase (glutamine-hydrolyzing) [Endozoicomonadaceae bacterium]|nr:asparagine synthase (glutamine-hydrolyzing) [Endozoicomonadaceae bacterium]
MCGIFGLINTPWQDSALTALKTLDSRGPDARQYWEEGGVYLGHTRLSVIDINGGQQPMVIDDGRYVVVFNGEIYNFQVLRKLLEKEGHVFITRSDTEVLLRGYIQWGKELPILLDGMFAFAILDNVKQKLFCARDRVGVKPFFYSVSRGFAFSSSLNSFLALSRFPKDLNYQALRDFLAFQTCFAPDSFLQEVKQLPPASQLSWDINSQCLVIEQYWKPHSTDNTLDQHEIVDQVDSALKESVKNQLVSDVPLGAFLSGGIDSRLMIHYMNESGVDPIDVFTLQFEQEDYDETPYAKEVAEYFGCHHHILSAPEIDGQTWVQSIQLLDQPLADPAYVMVSALSKLTRKHVTVGISGDGGDELFAGYPRFLKEASHFPQKYYQNPLKFLVDNHILPGSLLRRSFYGEESLLYKHVELGPWTKGRKSIYHFLNEDIYDVCKIDDTLHVWRELAGSMNTKQLMDADLWTYLSENCLVKTDRASMAYGLEVRVPMLGNSVLDLATSIPTSYHIDELGGKRILRKLAQKHLPESTWNRKKHGFSVPLQTLFQTSWHEPINELVERCDDIAPFLNHQAVSQLWQNAKKKKASRRLGYTFAVLLQWLDTHNLQ